MKIRLNVSWSIRRFTTILAGFLSVVISVASLSSCATIACGTKADIFIDGDVDEPVTISSSAGEYKDVTLPTLVEVNRHQLNGQHIHISSEHYSFEDIVLQKSFNGWALLSAMMYIHPFIIDLATNAVSKPKYDQFYITPIQNQTASDTLNSNRPTIMVSTMDHETRARLRSQLLPAKYPRHEINVSLGFGSNQADHSTQRFIDNITQANHMEVEGECGDIFGDSYVIGKVEYHYRLNRKWDVGAMMAWGVSSESYTNEYYYAIGQHQNDNPSSFTNGYQKCRSFSLAPSVRYTWYETRTFRLFSRVSMGMMRHHLKFEMEEWDYKGENKPHYSIVREERIDKTQWRMAYQLSPIGISTGSANVRFFAELGYGCLGVLNTGISFGF